MKTYVYAFIVLISLLCKVNHTIHKHETDTKIQPILVHEAVQKVYYGIPNVLQLNASDAIGQNLEIVLPNKEDTLIYQGNGKYILELNKFTPYYTIQLKSDDTINTQKFYVHLLPLPQATINRKHSGSISKGELLTVSGLMPIYDSLEYDAICKIQGFQVTLITSSGVKTIYTHNSTKFSDEVIKLLSKANTKDIIIFEKIKCLCPGYPIAKELMPMIFHVR